MNKLKENVLKEYADAYAWAVMYDNILHQGEIKISESDRQYFEEKYHMHLAVSNAMLRCLNSANDQKTVVPKARGEAALHGKELFEQWRTNNRNRKGKSA